MKKFCVPAAVLFFAFASIGMARSSTGKGGGATAEQLKKLTPEQIRITQDGDTEIPFKNEFWNHHEAGIYVDVVNNEPLFSSLDKFESGTGWPSFTRPIDPGQVETLDDRTLGMVRTEVRSKGVKSHLGHVFKDGPAPDHLRFCINSGALRFVPVRDLEKAGLTRYLSRFQKEVPGAKK